MILSNAGNCFLLIKLPLLFAALSAIVDKWLVISYCSFFLPNSLFAGKVFCTCMILVEHDNHIVAEDSFTYQLQVFNRTLFLMNQKLAQQNTSYDTVFQFCGQFSYMICDMLHQLSCMRNKQEIRFPNRKLDFEFLPGHHLRS